MKNKWLVVCAALFASAGVSMAQVPSYVEVSPDLGVAIQAALPDDSDYDLYESGLTAEVQFRDWFNHPWGYMLAVGYGEWASDSSAQKPGSNLYDFDGNLEVIPFGASALFQAYNNNDLSVILDLGIRYLSTDSQITARNSEDPTNKRYGVDIDDSVVMRVGVGVDYVLNETVTCSLGLGYQADLTNADVGTELGPARENVMEAFVLEAALRFPL